MGIDIVSTITSFGSDPNNYIQTITVGYSEPLGDNTFNNLLQARLSGVRNVNTGCEVFVNHVVEEPNTFDIDVQKISDAICFGDDGSIQLTLVDATYVGGFTWNIFDTNGTPTDRTDDGPAILTGTSLNLGPTASISVPAGDYIVEVTQDAFPECSQIRAFTITTPPAAISLDPINNGCGCTNDQGSALISLQVVKDHIPLN